MERISEPRAIALAKAFVTKAKVEHCGEVRLCSHVPFELLKRVGATSKKSNSGVYTVAFKYSGPAFPPELAGMCPAPDSDILITVDDVTGRCARMYHL